MSNQPESRKHAFTREQLEALRAFDNNPRRSFQAEGGPIIYLSDLIDLAQGSLLSETATIPEGWKLVPIEPTKEMLAAGAGAVLPEASPADKALGRETAQSSRRKRT